ncbi:MAG: hypothetical protein KDA28_12455, partial [Phycisphaerales bacterium]|nr:hypothetical protein [Phycisphaerales bacterium]
PVGHGPQALHTLVVDLLDDAGETIDTARRRLGLRTVELVTDEVEDGHDFHLRVNGRRIFCRGANWIPDDLFPSRIDDTRTRTRIAQAVGANMNMLRVWGGGLYESDAFYDACDEAGIMVWQDFLFSCAAYPEDPDTVASIDHEARDNVARLASHASLVLWCGNNECHEAHRHWGPFQHLRDHPETPWGRHYYHDLLPGVLRALDPTRPYWPSSPFTEDESRSPRDESSGDQHIWDVWNGEGDARRYLMHRPRFASEFGFHGPPTWATLERAIPPDQRCFDSPAMVHHNKHAGGQPLANLRMRDLFDPPDDFDDWLYLAQVVQARSLDLGCAWFRALSPVCSGALYWQFNDIWPGSSWAAIDGDGRPKPLWYATRRFFRPRLVTIRPARPATSVDDPGPLAVVLHNDTPLPWTTTIRLDRASEHALDPVELFALDVEVAPGAAWSKPVGDSAPLLIATTDDDRAFWFSSPDREMSYPDADLDLVLEREGSRHRLHVHARSLVRDLCLFADRLHPEATVSDQLLTLLPGDDAILEIEAPIPLDLEALSSPPVLQSVNRFGKPARD